MDRRTALRAIAAVPIAGLTLAPAAASAADMPTLAFDAAGRITNLDDVFRGVSWLPAGIVARIEQREVLARLPQDRAVPVKDEPPTWDGKKLIPPPEQVYHGVVSVRQARYVKLPYAKLANPMAPVVRRTEASTYSPA